MLFNSASFAIFLPIVFAVYWLLAQKNLLYQNVFLLACSYYFYACWDWRFLFLLMFSTALDYVSGIKMEEAKNENHRKLWFYASILINVGFLGFFKYFNFFADSFQSVLRGFGIESDMWVLQIILPVGISFYTFHGLSYVIDIYKRKIVAERNIVSYSLFVSYFPLLVAGPIERATHLLPQIKRKRHFNYNQAIDGLYQILWGLFKKVVIADSCALYANEIFDSYPTMNSFSLLLGAVYFAFQIYGDFSGYSDIALGVSKLFGIDLLRNFNYPYFSRDIAEFWRRWHISLSSWFKDYLYIPLGGSRGSLYKKIRNTFIIFLVSGFWHGANWTFVIWGAINALYFLPLLLRDKNRNHLDIVAREKKWPTVREFAMMVVTFAMTIFAWIFFRAPTIHDAIQYIKGLSRFSFGIQYLAIQRYNIELILLILAFILVEWSSRRYEHPVHGRFKIAKVLLIITGILMFGVYSAPSDFIYFQF